MIGTSALKLSAFLIVFFKYIFKECCNFKAANSYETVIAINSLIDEMLTLDSSLSLGMLCTSL